MPTAAWVDVASKVDKRPVDIIVLTVEAPLGGFVSLPFISKEAGSDVGPRLGLDLIPTLMATPGASVKIAEGFKTQRGVRNFKLVDEDTFEPFSATKTTVLTGTTYWTTFLEAFPTWFGATVIQYSFFDDPTLNSIGDLQPIFVGGLEDIEFNGDDTVKLVCRDVLRFRNRKIPRPTASDNKLAANVGATDTTVEVDDVSEYSDPTTWPSVDWMPPVARMDDGVSTEDFIYRGIDTVNNELLVARNRLLWSDDITNAAWVLSGSTFAKAATEIGPWGLDNANEIQLGVGGFYAQISPTLVAAGATATSAVWLKEHPDNPGIVIGLWVTDAIGSELTATVLTLSSTWQRVSVPHTFTGGATGGATFLVLNASGAVARFFCTQHQLTPGASREVFVASGAAENNYLGRGAYGSTAAGFSTDDDCQEMAIYKGQLDPSLGLSEVVVLRDFINREYIPVANVDQDAFDFEMNIAGVGDFARVIDDPRGSNELAKEVQQQGMIDMWATEAGLIQVRLQWRTEVPGTTIPSLDETADILSRSMSTNKDSRITRAFVYYGLKTVGGEPADGDKPEDFDNLNIVNDAAAEQTDNIAEKSLVIFSRWIQSSPAAIALASRMVSRFRLGAKRFLAKVKFDRYSDVRTGTEVSVTSKLLQSASGGAAVETPARYQVRELGYARTGSELALSMLETNRKRYLWIGPAGLPDYPAATDANREYGYIGDANNKVNGGTEDGYYIM